MKSKMTDAKRNMKINKGVMGRHEYQCQNFVLTSCVVANILSVLFLFIFALCYIGLCEDVFNSDLEFSESETTSACKYPSTVCFLGMKCDAYI